MELFSQYIGMEFGTEKCILLMFRNGKRQITEGIELLNLERIRMLEENKDYKYFRILELDTIKEAEMKKECHEYEQTNE